MSSSTVPEGEAGLWDTAVRFGNPVENVYTANQPISGAAWIETSEGVVVIDTLTLPNCADEMMNKIKARNGTVKYIVYTHGHVDHVGGTAAFMADNPEIISKCATSSL